MTEPVTRPTGVAVEDFLAGVVPARRREEGTRLVTEMAQATGDTPVMWGPSIIGFGTAHYRYASGREGDMPRVGFSPRKAHLVFYGLQDHPQAGALLEGLGPHRLGASCLYITRLENVDLAVLRRLIAAGYEANTGVAPTA